MNISVYSGSLYEYNPYSSLLFIKYFYNMLYHQQSRNKTEQR